MAKRPLKPKRKGQSKAAKGKIFYKDRDITYREERNNVHLQIAGVPIHRITRLDDGQYHSQFFPFRSFSTIEALAKALVDRDGQLWILSKDVQQH